MLAMLRILVLMILASPGLFAEIKPKTYQLLSRSTVELARPKTRLEEFKRTELYGPVTDGDRFFISTPDHRVECRSFSSGGRIWTQDLLGPTQGSWTVSDGGLYGGDTKGNLYALDRETGSVRWIARTKGIIFSRPLVRENRVWISTSVGALEAYDQQTGEWKWQQKDPGQEDLVLWSFQSPQWFQNKVVAGFPSGTLAAFDPQSSGLVWKESFNRPQVGVDSFNDLRAVSGAQDYLIASSFGGDLKVWVATGGSKKLLWEKKVSLHAPVWIEVERGRVYLSARDSSFQVLELKTGYALWSQNLPGLGTQPLVEGGRVWVGTSKGFLLVFDDESGVELARTHSYQSAIWHPPVASDEGEVLFLTSRGNLRRVGLVKTGL